LNFEWSVNIQVFLKDVLCKTTETGVFVDIPT